MFLRILASALFALLLGFLTYKILFLAEVFLINPRFCERNVGKAQNFLVNNGCGYFERPVKEACDCERFDRTMLFTSLGLIIGFLALILIPTDLTFWMVLPWTIKAGIAGGAVVNSILQYYNSMRIKSRVGLLKRIDKKGVCYFEGVWMPDFHFDISQHYSEDEYPEVGHKYMVLSYLDCIIIASVERGFSAM